ncbi:mitochondrial sodium/calcium exchanger protein-like isoform X2 [Patiria miniata]|uniref:Sodium/calcium exchanger membrane region domain-containing protein n=1 Tax=Patiria miniata TaxID=46514 RepID=A0A914BIT3_PATMI|nr:mitochondrial sodium/calcium exchanger protein-like isoform X2 [Patiria miniata]
MPVVPVSTGVSVGAVLVCAGVLCCLCCLPVSCSLVVDNGSAKANGPRLISSGLGVSESQEYSAAKNKPHTHLGVPECIDYHKINVSQQCSFIRATNDCKIDEGFVNYLEVAYCDFSVKLLPLALVLLFIWLIFLFVALGVTAEDFFCPSLTAISKSLKLSQNIAGVTFLAFGNGAPDIFSAIAAISNAKDGNAGLAIGALFGAGVFVTTVVAGSVSIAQPFELAKRPFLRDAIFYIGAAFWTFYVLYTGKIWTAEAIGFILLYVGYVLFVLIGRQLYQSKIKPWEVRLNATVMNGTGHDFTESGNVVSTVPDSDRRLYGPLLRYVSETYTPGGNVPVPRAITEALLDSEQVVAASLLAGHGISINTPPGGEDGPVVSTQNGLPDVHRSFIPNTDDPSTPLLGTRTNDDESQLTCIAGFGGEIKEFLRGINPIDTENWKGKSIIGKMYEIFKSPIQLVMQATVPLVDHTEDKHCWNRLLNCFQLAIGPLFCVVVTKNFSRVVTGNFMLWELMLCVGFLLALVVYLTSRSDKPPVYHFLFAYFAFGVSVLWIYSVANEIVNLLQMYGLVFQLSNAILGLTLLAWGNSIGDLVSDIAVAKQGYPRMAVAACFGGPLFNMLLGIGISCTIACIKHGGTFYLVSSQLQYVLAAGLVVSLFFSLFYHVFRKFQATRVYGICLYVLYVCFLVIAILTETKVIKW